MSKGKQDKDVVEVSFMVGGLFTGEDETVEARRLTPEERENVRLLMRELAVVSPITAQALIERRIALANEAVSASLSEARRATFDITLEPDHVLEGLPYLENIDDLLGLETMDIINDD